MPTFNAGNFTTIWQGNSNHGDNDANATSIANTGYNDVQGLLAVNLGGPATSTATAFNFAPVSQTNTAVDVDSLFDPDLIDLL
jgi:hypothetical protein